MSEISSITDVAVSNLETFGTIENNQRNLSIYVTDAAKSVIVVDFDNLILRDRGGAEVLLARRTDETAFSLSSSTSGLLGLDTGSIATGWYYIWIIFSKTARAVSAIFSLQYNTIPTLPSGYTFYRRVGAVYCTSVGSPSSFRPMKQFEDFVYYVSSSGTVPSIVSGTLTNAAWTLMTITNYFPRTAKSGRVCVHADAPESIGISPHSSGWGGKYIKTQGERSGTEMTFGLFGLKLTTHSFESYLVPESTGLYYFINFYSIYDGTIYALGYTDNLDMYY